MPDILSDLVFLAGGLAVFALAALAARAADRL